MKLVAALAAVCIALAVLIDQGRPRFSNASRPPPPIVSPGLALQMARNADDVELILGEAPSVDRETMRIKQYIDFGFIAAYVGLYIALARMFRTPLAIAAGVCGAAAGGFDVFENIGILRILDVPMSRTTQAMVDAIRTPSLIKWTLTWVAFGILASLFLRGAGWLRRSIGVLDAAAALIGMFGLWNHQFLGLAWLPMLAGLVGLVGLPFFGK